MNAKLWTGARPKLRGPSCPVGNCLGLFPAAPAGNYSNFICAPCWWGDIRGKQLRMGSWSSCYAIFTVIYNAKCVTGAPFELGDPGDPRGPAENLRAGGFVVIFFSLIRLRSAYATAVDDSSCQKFKYPPARLVPSGSCPVLFSFF